MARTHAEPKLESTIQNALTAYCVGLGNPQLKIFSPKANQQGGRLRQFCADLVGVLDDARVILLEVKERDATGVLPEFRQDQHDMYLQFEHLGVPVAYVYNAINRLAYDVPFPMSSDWPVQTLQQIMRSIPSELPDQEPDIDAHVTLLDWLNKGGSGSALQAFGRALGAAVVQDPYQLRNGLLTLIYSVSNPTFAMLSSDDMREVYRLLNRPTLNKQHKQALSQILGASADVFNRYTSSPSLGNTPQPGRRHRPGP